MNRRYDISCLFAGLLALAIAGCSASNEQAPDEDTGALTTEESRSVAALGEAEALQVYAADASVLVKKGEPGYVAALSAINLKQRAFDPSEVPVTMCLGEYGVRFIGAGNKMIGAFQLACGEHPSTANRVVAMVLGPPEVSVGLSIDGSALEKVAKGASAPAATGPLAKLATAASVIVYADDDMRTVGKADADFARVLDAVNLAQKPFDASTVPVAMCPSKVGVRFMADGNKLIGALGLTCGEAPGKSNRVVVSIGDDDEVGIVVNGTTIAGLAR